MISINSTSKGTFIHNVVLKPARVAKLVEQGISPMGILKFVTPMVSWLSSSHGSAWFVEADFTCAYSKDSHCRFLDIKLC